MTSSFCALTACRLVDEPPHRLWCCEAVRGGREELVKADVIQRACGQFSKEEEMLSTRGIFEHPGRFWPQPGQVG
eukprot:1355758-Pyramimonas_sp.AAC.1